MTAELKFITLEDKAHVVGFSEHTACGLPIPIGSEYTFDEPKDLHAACRHLIEDSDEYGVLKADIEAEQPKTWNEGDLSSSVDPAAPEPEPVAPPAETKKASGGKATAKG